MTRKKRKDTEAEKRHRAVKDLLNQCELREAHMREKMSHDRARREHCRLAERSRIDYVS